MSKGKGNGILLSEKHGVNPTLLACPVCGEDTGSLALLGRLANDAEAPRRMLDSEPCKRCAEMMKELVLLIEVEDGEADAPRRLGPIAGIPDETIRAALKPEEMANDVIKRRVAFVPRTVWRKLGLPEAIN